MRNLGGVLVRLRRGAVALQRRSDDNARRWRCSHSGQRQTRHAAGCQSASKWGPMPNWTNILTWLFVVLIPALVRDLRKFSGGFSLVGERPRGQVPQRATGTCVPLALAQRPNQRWSVDFVSDALKWGRRIRILCSVDDFTREGLALVVDTSIGGRRLVRELEALIARPAVIVSDNGREMTCRAVLEWCNRSGVAWH